MRNFYCLACALALVLAPSANAQEARTAVGQTSLGTLDASSQARVDPTALRHFDPDSAQTLLPTAEGGWVFGTNGYLDLAKVVWFQLPEGQTSTTLSQVNVYMARGEVTLFEDYEIVAYAAVSDGAGGFTPGDELYRESFDITALPVIPQDESDIPVTEHVLATPLAIDATNAPDGAFFVGVDVSDPVYELSTEEIAIVSSAPLDEHSPYEWEQWSNGTWHEVATAWSTNGWHMWLEAVVDLTTANEDAVNASTVGITALYPNPARDVASVRFGVEAAGEARVVVYDVLGRAVATAFDGVAQAGEQTVSFSTAALAAGTYVVRFESDRTVETQQLVVVK